jgi:ribonuclease Z
MSGRELIVLGTSSQVPTKERGHNAYMLRWDGEDFLLDPGEGTQRQLTLAGVATGSIRHICITHFHGDHCLGLAGVLQRLSLDHCSQPVNIYYPESGQIYFEHLCSAAAYRQAVEIVPHPIRSSGDAMIELIRTGGYVLKAHPLDHSIPTLGYRLEESDRFRFLAEKLDFEGIRGPLVGELRRKGWIQSDGRIVRLEDVAVPCSGSIFAFVMDTRPCIGAVALARDADLLVMEATYTSEHQDLANVYFHSTAADAARTASSAGAHRLALTHFSQRYSNPGVHLRDAREVFDNVLALEDLDRIEIPRRAVSTEV